MILDQIVSDKKRRLPEHKSQIDKFKDSPKPGISIIAGFGLSLNLSIWL